MLDFYFIRDEQPNNSSTKQLIYAGGIEEDEFEKAQDANIVESHLDHYGKFRWISRTVQQKRVMLTPVVTATIPNLASILKQAFAADYGLVAFGD